MRVLFLGPDDSPICQRLLDAGGDVVSLSSPLLVPPDVDWIVSHGYRHRVPLVVLQAMGRRAINCHIGYLPWNRGAHPILWSALDGTPQGVTIHDMDEGIDTGPILVQRRVKVDSANTFVAAHAMLTTVLADLFVRDWPAIRAGEIRALAQPKWGSTHRVSDYARIATAVLPEGWHTRIVDAQDRYAELQCSVEDRNAVLRDVQKDARG